MARSMSVKVSTAKVVEALTNRLALDEANKKENEMLDEFHKNEVKKWEQQVSKLNLEIESVSVSTWRNNISITYKYPNGLVIPDEPNKEQKRTLGNYELEEIQNALNILKMTDEEYVSASTMKSISSYL